MGFFGGIYRSSWFLPKKKGCERMGNHLTMVRKKKKSWERGKEGGEKASKGEDVSLPPSPLFATEVWGGHGGTKAGAAPTSPPPLGAQGGRSAAIKAATTALALSGGVCVDGAGGGNCLLGFYCRV